MSERILANALRIKVVDAIGGVDLPGFLFEQLDSVLNDLNYYKISNLYDNITQYTNYLEGVANNYVQYVKDLHDDHSDTDISHRAYNFEPFMTDELYGENFVFRIGKQQLLELQSIFCVSSILTMKEYINRRILQTSRVKQKAMSSEKSL